MKIKVKNLQQQTHEIEISPDSSVRDLKIAIFNQLGASYNAESQTLIYAGTILQDDQPIKTYNIDETKFIVCLIKTKSPSPPPTPAEQPQEIPTTDSPDFNEHIQSIMELGYSEIQVREALAASMNNPDRAVEFLISGSVPVEDAPNDGNHNVAALEYLRNQPQFAQMRELVQQHPELLEHVLREIGQSNPGLMRTIAENQEQFMEMLNGENDVGEIDENTLAIEVTEEDKAAIDRLKALGFPEDLVIQAYFACDKNENLAANFLLSSSLLDDL